MIPRGNAKELVAKIIQLLDDNDLAQRLGNAGYIRIVDKFTLEKMTLNYVSLYQRVLKH